MQENLTEVVIVLDRSGSMKSVTDETIGGYNQFIQGQKEVPGACNVTLVQFDNEYECVYAGKPLTEVPEMTRETFVPRGYTALLDAIGKTIKDTSARILAMQKSLRPAKVLMVIITDGGENASKEYEYKNVHSMIKDLRATNWEFVFLAANIDVADYAEKMGIHSGNAARYTSDKNGTKAALRSLNLGTARYRGGMSASVDDFWQKK